jgi:hypothetical protein
MGSLHSYFFNEVCKILGVKHHPAGNGPHERMHRKMKKAMSCYINASGIKWDEVLPYFLMSYRASPHSTTGHSHFFLLHGRDMAQPHTHHLRARLSPDTQRLDEAGRLRKLQASISLTNKVVRKESWPIPCAKQKVLLSRGEIWSCGMAKLCTYTIRLESREFRLNSLRCGWTRIRYRNA